MFGIIEIGLVEGLTLPPIDGPCHSVPKLIESRGVKIDCLRLRPVEPDAEMRPVDRLYRCRISIGDASGFVIGRELDGVADGKIEPAVCGRDHVIGTELSP